MKKPFAQYRGIVGLKPSLPTTISDVIEKRVRDAVEHAVHKILDGLAFDEHEVEEIAREIVNETFSELRK